MKREDAFSCTLPKERGSGAPGCGVPRPHEAPAQVCISYRSTAVPKNTAERLQEQERTGWPQLRLWNPAGSAEER